MSHRVVLFIVSLVLFVAATSGFVIGYGETAGQLSDAEGADITFTASADSDRLEIKTPTPDPVGQRVAVTEPIVPEEIGNTAIGNGGDKPEIPDKSDPAEVDGDNDETGDGVTSENDAGDGPDQSDGHESADDEAGEADNGDESSGGEASDDESSGTVSETGNNEAGDDAGDEETNSSDDDGTDSSADSNQSNDNGDAGTHD